MDAFSRLFEENIEVYQMVVPGKKQNGTAGSVVVKLEVKK